MSTAAPVPPAVPVGRVALWMTGAIGSFSAMAIAGRAVSLDHDTFELMLYRSIVGIVIVVAVAGALGRLGEVTTKNLGLHAVRNVFHFTGQNLWFYAITVVPLAQVFALEFTSPLWSLLLAPLILGERLTRTRVLFAALGFCGILIVARPFSGTADPNLLFAAASAIGFAGSAVFTRLLTRTTTIVCILFWLTVMQAVFGVICAGFDGDIALPTLRALPWLVVIGCAGLLAHFCLTNALSLAPATVVLPIDFLRLPLIAVLGMLIYGEPLDPWVFLGGGVIIAATVANMRSEHRAAQL
jgi:drug/metabolite transporter (DMT)-like permease